MGSEMVALVASPVITKLPSNWKTELICAMVVRKMLPPPTMRLMALVLPQQMLLLIAFASPDSENENVG